jgi:hypothetical protein
MKKIKFLTTLIFSILFTYSIQAQPYTDVEIQAAIDAATAGDIVTLDAATYTLSNVVNLNKDITLKGQGSASTILQVSGTGYRLNISAAGATIEDLQVLKTDKTSQNIIYLGANNISILNSVFSGQFVMGDGEVSRGLEFAGGLTGILIDGNTFQSLRQPAYVNNNVGGTIANNFTEITKGWVVVTDCNLTFTGNTWGTGANVNYYDIALINQSGSVNNYPDIVTVSANNNDAIIENQHTSYPLPILSIVHVDANAVGGNNGSVIDPYTDIQSAIPRVAEGGKINVANGSYIPGSTLNILKTLTIVGETETGVIIDASGHGAGYGILVKADNVSLSNFTLLPPIVSGSVGTSGGGGFPIHASYNSVGPAPYNNLALSNITIENSNRTPFDVHGYDGVTLTNLTAKNAAFGNGAQVTGCKNVLVSNLTTLNNAWGGFAIYASKAAYLNRGSDNVTVDFNLNSIDEFIYNEDEFGLVNTNTNILNWTYKINNNYNPGTANFTGYMNKTLGDALMFGAGLNSKFANMSSVVADPTGTTKYVGPGMSIQTAIDAASAGDVIDLAAGNILSPTQIHFDKNLTLQGKGKGVTFVQSNVNTASSGHSNDASAWIRTDPLTTVDISDLTLDATGYYTYTAVRFKSSGSVSNVAINEIKHASQYIGIAVQVQDGNVDITNCDFTQIGRIGVHYRAGVIPGAVISGTFDSNTYTGKGAGDYLDYALDISGATTVTVSNSTITNNLGVASTDGSTSGGVMATTYFPYGLNLPNSVLVTDCELTNNTTGIVVGYDASDVSSVAAHNNNIYDNTSFGISSLVTTVDATNNWWGDASGPQNPTSNPGGTGNAVNDNVIFDPWIGKAETQTASGAVPLTINFPTSGVDITFNTLPVGGGTVTVQRYNEVPSGYPAPPAGATHAGLWLDITSSMPNYSFSADVTVDVTGLGFDASTSVMYFNSTTNSWVAVNNGTYTAGAPETYSFTTNHFTPFSFINTPATAYNIYIASSVTATASSVIYPNDSWATTLYEGDDWSFTDTIDFYIVPEVGSIFGAADIVLQWDNTLYSYGGVDASTGLFDGAQFQFLHNQLGAVDQVTINASRLDNNNFTTGSGDFICRLQLIVLQPGYGPIDFTAMDFRAFDGVGGFDGVYVVGNSASVKSYLGDVASSGDASTGDGLINGTDLSLWASSYWSGVPGFAGGMANYKVKYDIGPTADNTVYTLPTEDGKIQFEDLVIFAISYGFTGDNVYPKAAPAPETPVELIVGEPMYVGSETLVPVSISGTVVDVRAMELAFGGSFGKLLGVEKGALLQNVDAPVMVMDKSTSNSANVDLAIFGADVEGLNAEGELITLRFDGRADVQLSSANVRNSSNNSMKIEITNSNVSAIPTSFALDQNYPNPFNPSTIISFQLPEQRQVKVAIFNMLGEEVSTLVNEVKEAGYHKVEWNGANLTSGVYFYRIEAGDFVSVKKMMLMK